MGVLKLFEFFLFKFSEQEIFFDKIPCIIFFSRNFPLHYFFFSFFVLRSPLPPSAHNISNDLSLRWQKETIDKEQLLSKSVLSKAKYTTKIFLQKKLRVNLKCSFISRFIFTKYEIRTGGDTNDLRPTVIIISKINVHYLTIF